VTPSDAALGSHAHLEDMQVAVVYSGSTLACGERGPRIESR